MANFNDNRGPGGWRPSDSLDMGSGSKGGTLFSYCTKCKHILYVNKNTAGLICPHCNSYTSIDSKCSDSNDLPQDVVFGKDDGLAGVAHIRTQEMSKHMEFRKNMEIKAENFKNAQRGKPRRYHGPMDTSTGELTK